MLKGALHFTSSSLQLFADCSWLGWVSIGGNALMDTWDQAESRAVSLARIQEKELAKAKLEKLDAKHRKALKGLETKALARIRKGEDDLRYVMDEYRKDVRALIKRIKELEGKK
jgi:hypothetical protein